MKNRITIIKEETVGVDPAKVVVGDYVQFPDWWMKDFTEIEREQLNKEMDRVDEEENDKEND